MKKRVDPEKATDPVSKALAAYQAQQDVMNPAGSSLHLEPSMNTMGRVDPPASKATTSYQTFGCIQEMCATPSTNGPLQTGEQFYNPISANLAPPLVTYPSLHTKHEKQQKGDIKLERIFSGGAVPGYSRPCLQSSLDVSPMSGCSQRFSGHSSYHSLRYSNGLAGLPMSNAAAPALQFQHSSLRAWVESGPLSTMDLPNHPSFSPVGAASPSSQGLPGMTIPVSLSQLGSFFSTSSMSLVSVNSIHSTAPLNSRPAPTSGLSLAMMDTQPQTFESMKGGLSKQLHIDCKDAEQCHSQGEELVGKQVLGHQDELSITANKAVSQYNNCETCALTELDLETDRDVDASMESEMGGLFYEPPQFPCSSESPFLSYDLIQNCQSLQAYSPLGIRQMIVSMGNCITTPPYHLSESPFQGNSPQSRLRSAAQSFSGSPSILRKRAHQLMIPAKQGSTGRKKDRQVGPSWTSPRIKEKKEITAGLLTCSVKTPDDTVQGNPTKDTVEWTARQATCQARTALFVSPSKHFGSVSNAPNVPQGLHPNSESTSQDYTNDRNGGVEYSSPPVYAQDCRQVATCSTGMCEAAGGKYVERRSHGFNLEYQSRSSRWGDSEQAMKVSFSLLGPG
jgi:myb proto-oncogene protein